MKQIIITLPLLTLLVGCASNSTSVTPSNNTALNKISPSSIKENSGFMQKSLDSFVKEDWSPTLAKDKNIQKKYMKKEKEVYVEDKNRNFTLQEFADKISAYTKAKPANHKNSNVTKLNALPVIGK